MPSLWLREPFPLASKALSQQTFRGIFCPRPESRPENTVPGGPGWKGIMGSVGLGGPQNANAVGYVAICTSEINMPSFHLDLQGPTR